MFDILPNFLTSLTILLPIYASHKALTTPGPQQPALLTPWLTYFLVLSLVHVAEANIPLIAWLPLYAYARLFIHIYLLLPGQTQGSTYLYVRYIAPFLSRHETRIETFISDVHEQLRAFGLDYVERIIAEVKLRVFGIKPTRRDRAAEAAAAPPTSNSYVASLLGRFSLPAAAGGLAPSGNQLGGIAAAGMGLGGISGVLGSALAQASSLAATSGALGHGSRGVAAGSESGLIPPGLTSDADRLQYIGAQKQRLKTLLEAFGKEEETIHLAGTGSDSGATMGRSKSEAEFETIREEDIRPEHGERRHSKGWGGWLMGKGQEAAKASGVDLNR